MASQQHVSGRTSQCRLGLLGYGVCLVVLLHGPAGWAGFESWSKVEQAPETNDYGQRLREGKFEAEQKAFVEQTLLPQLGLEANRASIAAVRLRIREIAVRGAAKPEVVEQGNATISDGMLRIVADKNADPVVRVNAMLLVGELQGLDRAPWPGAVAPLVKATADASLPLAVRVAALQGLARHVAAAGGTGPAAAAAAPVVAALVSEPPQGDPVAVRWLLARALDLLPSVPARPAAVTAAARILADDKADTDLRVRAAAAIGKLATPETGIDVATAIGQINTLAITALAADLAAADARRSNREISGGAAPNASAEFGGTRPAPPPPGPRPEAGGGGLFGGPLGGEFGGGDSQPTAIDEDAVPTLACRRNAWRLYALAEAVQPARAESGLARLLQGAPAAAAAELATTMRQSAVELDASPDEESLIAALEAIKQLANAGESAAGQNPVKGPVTPAQPASPFDQPASNSPF
jgi:hypothetical protein